MSSHAPQFSELVESEPAELRLGSAKSTVDGAQATGPAKHAAVLAPAGALRDFLAELLAEQGRLDTPVVRASQAYDKSSSAQRLGQIEFSPQGLSHPKSKIFESLIPLSAPRAGEQYAFEVDLDACTGCKACVSACHALNGLDENETWRDTGQLIGCASGAPVVQTLTTACHHCADPGCLNGCPVLAYEKDPLTGIVRHLDDQCIGCQYCVLKCPYDVPKYNARLGIVRKCDLCHQRLAHGEAPACAQACPTQAIRVVVVTTSERIVAQASRLPDTNSTSKWSPLSPAATNESRNLAHASNILIVAEDSDDHLESARDSERSGDSTVGGALRPDVEPARAAVSPESRSLSAAGHSAIRSPKSAIAFPGPDPTYTRPTTRYVTTREFPADLRAADAAALRPQHPHWPLVLMLTLLPWAIGLQALLLMPLDKTGSAAALTSASPPWSVLHAPNELVAYYATNRAAQLSLLPLALGALGLAAATFHLGQPLRAWRVFLGLRTSWFSREAVLFGGWFGLTALAALLPQLPAVTMAAAVTGLAGLACSAMIYIDTRRRFWRAASTAPRFLLGGALLALGTLVVNSGLHTDASPQPNLPYYGKFGFALALLAKLAVELAALRGESVSARLQRGPLFGVLRVRLGLAAGAAALLAVAAPGAAEPDLAYYARLAVPLALLLAGEIAERYLFFRAVDAPKMPGYATR